MTNPNPYSREYAASLLSSAKRVAAITPDDNINLAVVIKALRILNLTDNAINVSFITVEGDTAVMTFPPGVYREDVQIIRVLATNTSSDAILHGYFD